MKIRCAEGVERSVLSDELRTTESPRTNQTQLPTVATVRPRDSTRRGGLVFTTNPGAEKNNRAAGCAAPFASKFWTRFHQVMERSMKPTEIGTVRKTSRIVTPKENAAR